MSNISSNTVFHFTNWGNLLSILKEGFYPRYSLENLPVSTDGNVKLAIPMVSFCDIPLSQIKEHVKTYGSYGIGMTKKWANKAGLNPVLYLRGKSELNNKIQTVFVDGRKFNMALVERYQTELESMSKNPSEGLLSKEYLTKMTKEIISNMFSLFTLISYTKKYKGFSEKRKKKICFYDEREWRYVPDHKKLSDIKCMFLSKEEFQDKHTLSEANSRIENTKLNIVMKDINYIIVKNDSEILTMIKELENIKKNKHTGKMIKKLTSRIITYQQIKNDL
ncbi:MAG: abortive infection system antitoxin AbiGi family protein [Thermodesulfovibrionales bacterium]